MTLDNMTGITEGSYTGFCKSQLITCNRVKECNGVCPFEGALKHADKMQTMDEQHTVDHDRNWITGCILHDGFIHTDRGDKANQIILDALSSEADRPTDEEDQLKFYYVESIDDYWVGRRLDNFYYANWHEGLGFIWSHSRYLPWGEHIVDENTLWKEHTYPSEPVEIPFPDWIVGFVNKYFADRPTGEWVDKGDYAECSSCGAHSGTQFDGVEPIPLKTNFCPNCGNYMGGTAR